MTSPNDLVSEFHETYGHPIRSAEEPTVDYDRVHMRYALIAEEFAELTEAIYGSQARRLIEDRVSLVQDYSDHRNRDVVETADALADMVYVIYGMALESGIPLDEVLEEVQRSNMSKLPPCAACSGKGVGDFDTKYFYHRTMQCPICNGSGMGEPLRREDGKILKGPNFSEPNIKKILFKGDLGA
jgi:predicted HAD superfamily Cof-like phosphohydrolase